MSTRFNFNFVGALFTVAAGYFLFVGLTLQTTIGSGGETVANLQLMHIQAMDIAIGIGAAIVAAIFVVGAALAP